MTRRAAVVWLLCAWVVWENSVTVKGGSDNVPNIWRITRYASDTKPGCETLAKRSLAEEGRSLPDSKITASPTKDGTGVIFSDDGPTFMRLVYFVCLPSGTDPRPRGKE